MADAACLLVFDALDDFKTNNSMVGNAFMNAVQPLVARTPFMPAPGYASVFPFATDKPLHCAMQES
jgi:hypothetical protein